MDKCPHSEWGEKGFRMIIHYINNGHWGPATNAYYIKIFWTNVWLGPFNLSFLILGGAFQRARVAVQEEKRPHRDRDIVLGETAFSGWKIF